MPFANWCIGILVALLIASAITAAALWAAGAINKQWPD